MKKFLDLKPIIVKIIFPLILVLLTACAPQSKEEYLEEYKAFIAEANREYESYTEEDWERSLEEYERFSGDWFLRFKDELTWKEALLVGKYEVQYNLMRVKESSVNFWETYLDDDFKGLKEQVKFYYENEMEEDIEFLVDQAKEIGDSAVSVMKEIFRELEIELEELMD